jgi:hypothetical protein
MKNFICFFLAITLAIFLGSCIAQAGESPSTETLSDDQLALDILVDFLQSLHAGQYVKAAQLYGGTYEFMIDHNPGLDPGDHAELLQNACTINGAQCLEVKSAGLDKRASNTEFIFKVDFLNPDRTLFEQGPCCGGSATDFPPQSVFYFTVVKVDEDKFAVMDMPPYVP